MAKKPNPLAGKKAAAAKKPAKPNAAEAAAAAAKAAKAAATRAKKYADEARRAAEEAKAAADSTSRPRDPQAPPAWQNHEVDVQNGQLVVKVDGIWVPFESWLGSAGSLRLVVGLASTAESGTRAAMASRLAALQAFLACSERYLLFVARCQSENGTCPDID